MSWQTRLALLLLPLALTACGFKPMYGKPASGLEPIALAGVAVDPIAESRMGQQFRAELEDKLNPDGRVPPDPAYRLDVTLTSSASPIGVARDGTISRYNVYLDSTYTLYNFIDGTEVTSGSLRHVSSYNNLVNAYFSTFVSEQDAIKRGVIEMAEQYRLRLAPYLKGQRPPKPEGDELPPAPIMFEQDGSIIQPVN